MWVLCKGDWKWSKPKEPRDSAQFTKALDIIHHLLYLLEKVECHPDQGGHENSEGEGLHPSPARMAPLLHGQWIWTMNVGHFSGADFLPQVVKVVSTSGSIQTAGTLDNNTPVHIAKQNNCLEIVNALTEAGPTWTPPVPSRIRPARCFMRNAGQDHHSALQLRDPTVPCGLHLDNNKIPYKGFIP